MIQANNSKNRKTVSVGHYLFEGDWQTVRGGGKARGVKYSALFRA